MKASRLRREGKGRKMANRRMFSLDVVNTDKFMDMPISAQCLYFHMGMRADDDGFVSTPRQVIKSVSCSNDDLKILVSKGYVIPFETGVIVIRHWKQHNYIQSDRYRKTRYTEERSHLELIENVYRLDTECIQPVSSMDTQYRLSKDIVRLDKDNITIQDIISTELQDNSLQNSKSRTLDNDVEAQPEPKSGILLPLNDKSLYDVPEGKISMWEETYPAVDVKQELRKMAAWLDSNPTKRKTRRGIERFINNWLSRQQDRGGSSTGSTYRDRQQGREAAAGLSQEYAGLGKRQPSPDDPFQ